MNSDRGNINLLNHFFESAHKHSAKVALIHGGKQLLFSQLKQKVDRNIAYLDQQNLSNDAVVLMLHPLSHDLMAMLLALIGRGNPIVFVEEWTQFKDLKECVKQTNCKYILCNWKLNLIRKFIPWAKGLTQIPLKNKDVNAGYDLKYFEANRTALISFSSGSSGQPKSIIRTQGNLMAQFEALSGLIKTNEDTMMCTNFAAVILLNLGLGIGTLISDHIRLSDLNKTDPNGLYKELKKYKVSNLACSPIVVRSLANFIIDKKMDRLKFDQIICGGSPVFPSFIRSFESAFDSEQILLTYGSSEAEPIAHCLGSDLISNATRKGLYIGKPVSEVNCKLMNGDGSLFGPEQPFKIGEILVSGNHVVTKYLGAIDQINKKLIDDKVFHLCGDLAYFDEKGNLFLTGQARFENEDIYENEKSLYETPDVKYITEFKGVIFVEMRIDKNRATVLNRLNDLRPGSKVKFIQMPVDRRHKGKVKYTELNYSKTI